MCEGNESKSTLYCSFCGKSQNEVRKLVAGPTVFICNECVVLCLDIILDPNGNSGTDDFNLEYILKKLDINTEEKIPEDVLKKPLVDMLARAEFAVTIKQLDNEG